MTANRNQQNHIFIPMKKVVLTYGLIAGSIVAAMMFITMPLYETGTLKFENGELVGYTTMAVALSMIFFGIKSYRDNYEGGEIKFWKAVRVGLLITAIASVMYALAWEITYNTMSGDFMKLMVEHRMSELKESGVSQAEIDASRAKWEMFSELYKNPFIRFGMTLIEIAPVGLAITFISAGLLRKKTFLPGQPVAPTNAA
jgi:ABC-type sugar transport system permease subunit